VLETMVVKKKLNPILDLVHYGTPLWLENSFINASFPKRVAEYAYAVAERYKSLVQYYTPLNEASVTADRCGKRSEWPPYLVGDDGYVKIILAVARGIVETVTALRSAQPEAKMVHVKSLWHQWTLNPDLLQEATEANQQQYLALDLVMGRMNEQHPLFEYLSWYGFSAYDLQWFSEHKVGLDILGANFYPWSDIKLVETTSGGGVRHVHGTSGLRIALVLRDAYQRYGLPLMVTETSRNSDVAGRKQWMDETVKAVRQLRQEGVPVVGYTWFPLISMIDWAFRCGRAPIRHYLLHLGLYDSEYDANGVLQRHPTELVEHYRRTMSEPLPPVAT
jgi:beta-glucosidase/6-phospho-beta-glucosidase/beta-galactosidase